MTTEEDEPAPHEHGKGARIAWGQFLRPHLARRCIRVRTTEDRLRQAAMLELRADVFKGCSAHQTRHKPVCLRGRRVMH